MKKIVTFTKNMNFKTKIAEITNIEVDHNLELNDNYELKGNIIVSGKYKMTEASIIEEDFNYNLPSVIAIDSKYDTSNLEINISDFNYEIINEESLNITVDIELSGLEEVRHNDIPIPTTIEEINEKVEYEEPLIKLDKEIKKEKDEKEEKIDNYLQESEENKNFSMVLSNLTDSEETFSTYHVYIVRENDTIDKILDKYKVSREELADYNDLDNISLGTKLIIPCTND